MLLKAVLLVFALDACGDEPVERLEGLRDQLCACKTSACADGFLHQVQAQSTPSNRRTQRLAREMMDCLSRIHLNERPPEEE